MCYDVGLEIVNRFVVVAVQTKSIKLNLLDLVACHSWDVCSQNAACKFSGPAFVTCKSHT